MGGVKGYDSGGNPVDAPDAATADEMFAKGEFRFKRGQKISIRTPEGKLGEIAAEEYEAAREQGMALVSDAEVADYKERKKYEAESGIEAAVRAGAGATVDTFTALGSHIGVTKEFRDISTDSLKNSARERERRYEASPIAAPIGEAGAVLLPALVSGGTSLAARAGAGVTARGLGAATARASVAGISEVAGTTASNLAIKAATKAGVKGALARKAIGLVAQGAAEGSIQGAREGLIQGTLDDKGKTAEAILMGAGAGALYGAAGNAIVGGAMGAAGKAAGASADAMKALAARATRNAAAEVGEAAPAVVAGAQSATERFLGAVPDASPGGAAKVAAKVTGADAGDVANMLRAEGADAIDNPERWLDGATRELTEKLDETVDAAEHLDDALFKGAGKLETIKRVSGGTIDPALAAERASAFVADARDRIVALRANAGEFERYGALNKLAKGFESGEYESRIAAAVQDADDPGAAIMFELDNIKREIGYAAKQKPGDVGPIQSMKAQVGEVYEATRHHLEDAGAWGAVADMQREVNEGWTQSLRQSRKYNKEFREVTGSQGFEVLRRHDPEKVKGYVKKLGEFEARNSDDALAEMLEGSRKRAETYARFVDSPAAAKNVERIDRLRESWQRLTTENKARTSAEKVAAQSQRRLAGAAALAGAAGLTGMATGSDGTGFASGAGILAAAAARPQILAQTLASARAMIGRRSGAILSASGGVATRARAAGAVARKYGKPALRTAGAVGLMVAYRDKVREVAQASPSVEGQEELDVITPGLGQAVSERRAAALDFLKTKMPTGAVGSGTFGHLAKPAVSSMEARRFMSYVRGVEEPIAVLEDVKRGVYSPESIEAVQAVYPQTFEEMRTVVMEQVAGLEKPPPYESRRELGILFGIPSDFIFTPGAMQRMSSGPEMDPAGNPNAGAPAPSGGRSKPPKMPNLSGALQTERQRIAAKE
jgi:hypothetical protein